MYAASSRPGAAVAATFQKQTIDQSTGMLAAFLNAAAFHGYLVLHGISHDFRYPPFDAGRGDFRRFKLRKQSARLGRKTVSRNNVVQS
jgi:hypothetical protein